jgi:NADH:ubiquinone reductase (H+-translocating)
MPAPAGEKQRVVIVGAGFGGLSLAKGLAGAPYDVTLIDRHNYHLFQPLLYQVATAALSPADIAAPIRAILRGQTNVTVVLANVSGVDVAAKQVIAEGERIPYDILALATGAQHAYFGHDDWAPHAPGLKTIDDATYLRRQILLAFERAEAERDAAERARLLTFVIVGGGPTGVEMAGAIAELAKWALAADFRNIDPRSARIILVEGGPRLLPALDPSLSEKARQSLQQLGAEVRLNAMVTSCSDHDVAIGEERIETRTIMWAAGVKASPAAEWLGVPADRAGRVRVEPDLSVAGHADIFVLGDTALALDAGGKPLPGVAPVAKQQGQYLAKRLIARTHGQTLPPFRYRDFGSLATIGRKYAVADFGKVRLSGFIAWVLWSAAHVYFLIGFRRRAIVALHWAWSYITFQRGTRLITGLTGSRLPDDETKKGSPPMRGAA